MKIKPNNIIVIHLLLFMSIIFGQLNNYSYKRQIKGVEGEWHKIILPNEMFQKIENNFNDLRIIGFTEKGDTIEVPYLLNETNSRIEQKELSFSVINKSNNDKGYFYTFELPMLDYVNQINLKFTKDNYDWRVSLEGSQNLNNWFNIIDNYRLVSISNNEVNFNFSKILFSKSKYKYYRLFINSLENPELEKANIFINEDGKTKFNDYKIKSFEVYNNKQKKQTQINIKLNSKVPVSKIKIEVQDKFDYYRPCSITYIQDSIKTEKGWKYNTNHLSNGTLNSFEENSFLFEPYIADNFIITIDNFDNKPLVIEKVLLQGPIYELLGRYDFEGDFNLFYGNKKAKQPNYDLKHFVNKIPEELNTLVLGNEIIQKKDVLVEENLFFENKIWLWIIISSIVLLLGWFSIKMLKK